MNNVVQIKISGESGYVPAEKEYSDVLIITDHSIEYDCKPFQPCEMNPVQHWLYKTNSPRFTRFFNHAVSAVHKIFERDPKCTGTDMPVTKFSVTYQNKKSVNRTYMVSSEEFKECFSIIRMMVPILELIPHVLQKYEDFR